jgi:hypothetical protein
MDKKLIYVFLLACSIAWAKIPHAVSFDVPAEWSTFEEVVRTVTIQAQVPVGESCYSIEEISSVSFGIREVERVIEEKAKLNLSSEEYKVLVLALIQARSVRQIAILGCVICLAESQNVSPSADPQQLACYFSKQVIPDVIDRREQALRSLKILTQSKERP